MQKRTDTNLPDPQTQLRSFYGDGLFDWQIPNDEHQRNWEERVFNPGKYWGGFLAEEPDPATWRLPDWAIGPFAKYEGNPVFEPSADGWDRGHISGGVHNGSILYRDGTYLYVYRGEQRIDPQSPLYDPSSSLDYFGDIGLATSSDGVHLVRDSEHSPFFRHGEDEKYSFEDVNLVTHDGVYYLFCNRWNWKNPADPGDCGITVSTSRDLRHWHKHGLVFPQATEIHRNACVLQNPHNEAVRVNGKFVMYINNGLIAYSDDLLHWQSEQVHQLWPGGEGCFALADYHRDQPDNILLFTGGHHSGNFYAIGEVLLHKDDPGKALQWLPRPILKTEDQYPWENGLSARAPYVAVSSWRNTIFFTGMTLVDGLWRMYYGGSEYYTCLATAPAQHSI